MPEVTHCADIQVPSPQPTVRERVRFLVLPAAGDPLRPLEAAMIRPKITVGTPANDTSVRRQNIVAATAFFSRAVQSFGSAVDRKSFIVARTEAFDPMRTGGPEPRQLAQTSPRSSMKTIPLALSSRSRPKAVFSIRRINATSPIEIADEARKTPVPEMKQGMSMCPFIGATNKPPRIATALKATIPACGNPIMIAESNTKGR